MSVVVCRRSDHILEPRKECEYGFVASVIIGADELGQNKRVEDLDEPAVGEASLFGGPCECAKSTKVLCVR